MAKGNMMQGYARGSVGDIVFSRMNGVQVAKARNRTPKNPKTAAQMYQRAKFAGLVSFFKLASAGTLKFAFEDKRPNESDFNAFMRHNVNICPAYSKGRSGSENVLPSPFVASRGSLGLFEATIAQDLDTRSNGKYYIGLSVPNPNNEVLITPSSTITAGEVFQVMVNKGMVEDGDIITGMGFYVNLGSLDAGTAMTMAYDVANINDSGIPREWVNSQLRIDVNNKQTLATYNTSDNIDGYFRLGVSSDGKKITLVIEAGDGQDDETSGYGCFALVRSSVKNGVTRVSDSSFLLQPDAKKIYEQITVTAGEYYKGLVLDTWGASDEAILQGSLTKKKV